MSRDETPEEWWLRERERLRFLEESGASEEEQWAEEERLHRESRQSVWSVRESDAAEVLAEADRVHHWEAVELQLRLMAWWHANRIHRQPQCTAPQQLICPLQSGPSTIIVWTTKEAWNGSEAQA